MKIPRHDGAMALVCLFTAGYTLGGYALVQSLLHLDAGAGAWLAVVYLVGLVILICRLMERGL